MTLSARHLAAPLVAIVVNAAPAGADQQFSWISYCTVGSLQFCASVELTLAPNDFGGTDITVRMRNLQGVRGETPWRMHYLIFGGLKVDEAVPGQPGLGWFYPPQATLTGSAGFHLDIDPDVCAAISYPVGPCPAPNWGATEWFRWSPEPGRYDLYWTEEGVGPYMGNMVGCDVPSLAPSGDWLGWGAFQTCGDGWVGVALTIPGTWTFDELSSVGWSAYSDYGSTRCLVGTDNCVQVTPEPVTIVLLGTGLAGVGAAALRRRRSGSGSGGST